GRANGGAAGESRLVRRVDWLSRPGRVCQYQRRHSLFSLPAYELNDMSSHDPIVIAGIGSTEFSQGSGRSELQLAAGAAMAALTDAGIEAREVDGFSTVDLDNNAEVDLQRAIGAGPLTFFSRIHYGGGGGCATIQQAVLALRAGVANVVIAYRAMNERS